MLCCDVEMHRVRLRQGFGGQSGLGRDQWEALPAGRQVFHPDSYREKSFFLISIVLFEVLR